MITEPQVISIIGWIGAILLAICPVPQVILTLRSKNVDGLSLNMMHCLFLGCLFALVFGIYTKVPAQLICSYILNIISASILIICIHLWRKR